MTPMPPETVQIRLARPEEVVDLRHAVLRAGLPRSTAVFDGDSDPETRHLVAVGPDGRVIGCATILRRPSPFGDPRPAWQLRGMAVEPGLQGAGLGSRLLAAGETIVRESGHTLMWCNARTPAVAFYRRHGWETVGEEFPVETAGPHICMRKELPAGA